MKMAFTLCSNNYLAQAKTLGDSLLAHNSGYRFVIGLVDKKSPLVDYDFFSPHLVIPIEEIGIPDFNSVCEKFNIIELNTAVKPSFFKYLFEKFPDLDFLFYLDPDIMIFSSLQNLERYFEEADILLTPHIVNPIPLDNLQPSENTFLNYGLYNLGFAGIKSKSMISDALLDWWEERTLSLGFIDVANGIFVDQLWLNLAPLYFEKIKIVRGLGYNVAPWNLHERRVKKLNDRYFMNDGSSLSFYHFSSYNYHLPEALSKYYDRYNFQALPELRLIYDEYSELLKQNHISHLSKIQCYYVQKQDKANTSVDDQKRTSFKQKIKSTVRLITPPFFWTLIKKMV